MQQSVPNSKTELRQKVRALVKRLDPAHRAAASAQACELLKKQVAWERVQSVLFYAPLAWELDIWPLTGNALAAGKTIGLLRHDSQTRRYEACRIHNPVDDLRSGQFDIREPNEQCRALPLDEFALVLVPGVAFDLKGRRLGRGRGIYDRLLTLVRGATCGVAFDEQIAPEIPVEGHDVLMKYILTPTRWVEI